MSKRLPREERRRFALGVGGIVAVQLAISTVLGALLGTWQDEEYSLATTAHGVAYALGRAISYELQAPLYFVLLAALRTIDPSPFFARLLSIVAACALTALAAWIARRIGSARQSLAFAALVAANPFVVYAALEIRLYALALLVSAALWLAFDIGYLRERRPAAQVALTILAIAAAYLQYFLVFELVGFAVALAVLRRTRALVRYVALLLPAALAFAPLALVVKTQVGGAFAAPISGPGAFGSIFVHPLLDFVLPIEYETVLGTAGHVIDYAVLAAVALLGFAGRPRPDARTFAIVAIAATIEILYAVTRDVLHYDLIVPRHFVALFVPEAVAAFALVCAFRSRFAGRYAVAIACLAALTSVASLGTTYRALAKQGDWPRVGKALGVSAAPGDTIAIFEADAVPAFRRYYTGKARVVPLPREVSPDRYDAGALVIHSEREATASLAALSRGPGRLWVVRFGGCDRFDFFGCLELEAALVKNYRIVEHRVFFLNTVDRIEPLSASRIAP